MKKITTPNDPAHHIAVFQETTIRRVWHNEEWWFAIVDVVGVLTDSTDPGQYIKKMSSHDPALNANWGTTYNPYGAGQGWRQIATILSVTRN